MQKGVWDYRISQKDLKGTKLGKWLLTRQISVADWKQINLNRLKKYLPKLDIDRSLKEVLGRFIKSYDKNQSSLQKPTRIP